MVLRHHFLSALLLWAATAAAQEKSFTIEGRMPLPDGYNAALSCHTDTAFATIVAEDWVKDGRFTLKGNIDKPYQGTLMTNNLALVERNHWPTDSIRWTYTEVFVTPDSLQFGVCPSPSALLSSPATIPAASATADSRTACERYRMRHLTAASSDSDRIRPCCRFRGYDGNKRCT